MTETLTLVQNSSLVYALPLFGIPEGVTVQNASLLIKNAVGDDDTAALVTKAITSESTDSGQLENEPTSHQAMLRFAFSTTDTGTLDVGSYLYFFKVWFSDGQILELPNFQGPVRVIPGGVQAVTP